jgi:hypothetical protein
MKDANQVFLFFGNRVSDALAQMFGQGILISRPSPGPDIVRGRDKKPLAFCMS